MRSIATRLGFLVAFFALACRGLRNYLELVASAQFDNAVNFRKAIRKDPSSGEAYLQLALADEKRKDGAAFQQKQNSFPAIRRTWYWLCLISSKGNLSLYLRKAFPIQPMDSNSNVAMTLTRLLAGPGDLRATMVC